VNGFVDAKQITLMGIALAIGLLIGAERGWKSREAKDGERIAGLRTYGLTGLLGGGAGLLSQYLDAMVLGFIFLGFSITVATAYTVQRNNSEDASITSLITMLLTFILGVFATLEHVDLAASIAVLTAILLRYKEALHGWLKKLEKKELHAALQLLLISVVLLPILPDRGYGPWQALNPYEISWMVVLIASISFSGYFTMKIAGPSRGVILTALAAGMASSTALTLHYARLSQKQETMRNLLAAGILLACGTMFPRVLLVSSLINPALFSKLLVPMSVMMAVVLLSSLVIWHKKAAQTPTKMTHLINPLELKSALFFGALLVLVILLSKAAIDYFGEAGIYLMAMISGIADVDPINLALSRMSTSDLSVNLAALGIVIAASSNTLIKALLASFIGGPGLGMRVLLPLLAASAVGLTTAWLM
jgi:uncharacterized membrane protein (DUF4010 family)